MMKAGITVKRSTRKSQSSLIQPFFFQLVIDHIYQHFKIICHFHLNPSMGKFKRQFVFPEMDWSFVQHPANMTMKQGENVTVVCRPPYSRPMAQVSWFKNNQLYIPKDNVAVLPSGDLFFQRCVFLKTKYEVCAP